MLVDGSARSFGSPNEAQAQGVAVIYQEPTLFPDLSVAENVMMRRQPIDNLHRIQWGALYAQVQDILDGLCSWPC